MISTLLVAGTPKIPIRDGRDGFTDAAIEFLLGKNVIQPYSYERPLQIEHLSIDITHYIVCNVTHRRGDALWQPT